MSLTIFEKLAALNFAHVFGIYSSCSPAIQEAVQDMCEIINSNASAEDEIHAACSTLVEAISGNLRDV